MTKQHGAWAMLALPIVVGIAASRPVAAQALLAGAALGAYLFSAAAQAWIRARRRPGFGASLVVYGVATVGCGVPLLLAEPRLALAAAVVVPAAVVTFRGARPGTPRELATSLAAVAQGAVLAPAAMLLAGRSAPSALATVALVVAAEMAGSVLVVRSVIRERDNPRFAALSVGFHGAATVLAALTLPPAYAALGIALTARALVLPLIRRRRAFAPRPLRPVQVGAIEAIACLALVLVAVIAPL